MCKTCNLKNEVIHIQLENSSFIINKVVTFVMKLRLNLIDKWPKKIET
jgi:hypothetical protein